jgi:hypothetical protein
MNGMLASALIGLSVVVLGLIIIHLTPERPRPPSSLDELREHNTALERRVAALETRIEALTSGGSSRA